MRVLLIGSGGREHAIAEALLASPLLSSLAVVPGNPGTSALNVGLNPDSNEEVVAYCQANQIDLVVVGPEGPLVNGVADALAEAGIRCFGPSAAAAKLEGSKSFARQFAMRHGIPGPATASFTEVEPAIAWLHQVGNPVVVKADGLAAGKGVVIPQDRVETERAIFEMLAEGSMGHAGARIVLEERMEGPEVSLIGFCDGSVVRTLPPAQDHKRVGENNTGLNTGGMGAFAPVPGLDPAQVNQLATQFLQAAVDGMAADGAPYVGVLYAGLMLTADGPRLIEYNCRFGDPEAQVVLPLLTGDLLEIMVGCVEAKLASIAVEVSANSSAAVVVAAEGYPAKATTGIAIPGPGLPGSQLPSGVQLIQAGTALENGTLVSSGGRVLNVVSTQATLAEALSAGYQVVNQITAAEPRLFARPDIGPKNDAYAAAGVSFEAGDEAIRQITEAVKETHNDRVVAGVGSFGGVFDLADLGMEQPLLVSSTDTCGTKTVLAAELDMWHNIGADIVNHGVNDVLVQGARPLFMLDTISAGRLDPNTVGTIVRSMAAACKENDCVLLGGETAEVPDLIVPGGIDVAGTMVGVVNRPKLLPSPDVEAGDVLVGLESSGLHTNGYSLARKLGASYGYERPVPGSDGPLGQALLAPHRSYLAPLAAALEASLIKALAHLTGGGFADNIPRCLPPGLGARVNTAAWPTPPLFSWLQAEAAIGLDEAHRIWNMGIGMIAVVGAGDVEAFRAAVPETTFVVGAVTGTPGVELT